MKLAFAFLLGTLIAASLSMAAPQDVSVAGPGQRPPLWFACCDHGIEQMNALFADGTVIADLKELHAGIAMALDDLSPERAAMVQRLNTEGVPMIAWLVLAHDQGYYVNASNATQTTARYEAFQAWSRENHLRWDAVGLDIEPVFDEWRTSRIKQVGIFLRRSFDGDRVWKAREDYHDLIQKMQSDGHRVQTYQMMFIADERRAHSTMLERWFGMVDVRGDEEVLMTYSSFNHRVGSVIVWDYGPDAQALAVGSTLGSDNPQTDARTGPLDWDEFISDTLVASHFSKIIGVYSLEGCVKQGFLAKLKTVDWNQGVTLRGATVAGVGRFRKSIQAILWLASHFYYLLVAFVLLLAWGIWWLKRPSRRPTVQVA
jgi:hypothetical protein